MNRFFKKLSLSSKTEVTTETQQIETKSAIIDGGFSNRPVLRKSYDGEKTYGELGPPINLVPNHKSLRLRAYEADLESDIIKIVTGKFLKWTVGIGLKLQAEPNEIVLESESITEDWKKFKSLTEARFSVYANSCNPDYTNMHNLHKIANDAFKTSFIGGDCLNVMRYENEKLSIQVIDGQEVSSPLFDSKFHKEAKERGNEIKHGIEIDEKGEHVAFYVEVEKGDILTDHVRIEARGESSGVLFAWMIYGTKHRINHHRGIPIISAILEKAKKLDRYTEASVSSAEERAKIVYAIEHGNFSTGENPLIDIIKKNLGNEGSDESFDPFALGENMSGRIALTTNKQVFNMPIGSKLAALESNAEDKYAEFFEAVFVQICAAVDIPPEVALQRYNSNYSASRAAINGWGYIINIYRTNFANDFYKKFYSVWLRTEILKGKIPAPGFLKALRENNYMAKEAYLTAKFTGVNMPHIDPLKEVNSVRAMMGDASKGEQPFISHEQAAEILNLGDWSQNIKKYSEEEKDFVELPDLVKKEENTDSTKKI